MYIDIGLIFANYKHVSSIRIIPNGSKYELGPKFLCGIKIHFQREMAETSGNKGLHSLKRCGPFPFDNTYAFFP